MTGREPAHEAEIAEAGLAEAGLAEAGLVADGEEHWPVVGDPRRVHGALVTLRTDQVRMPDGAVAPRDVIEHPGAVAVLALDEHGRVLLIRQYRHPVGRLLWEIPAGLRDVQGEPALTTAKRELWEETGHAASQWHVLADCYSSPGISTERLRIFLARGVTVATGPAYQASHEEKHLIVSQVALEKAVSLVLAGDLHNGVAAIGILAAYAAKCGGFAGLREAEAHEG
jgi:ADP-ribose pyrophosphatase